MSNKLIYISSNSDELANQLDKALKPFVSKRKDLRIIHKSKIYPGDNQKARIVEFIEQANYILVILNMNFLAENNDEIFLIKQKAAITQTKVILIQAGASCWECEFSSDFVSLPSSRKRLSHYSDQDDFWYEVANGLQNILMLDSENRILRLSCNVPISRSPARAGDTGIGFDDDFLTEINESIEISGTKEGDILFKISGNSMSPYYNNGDYILCRKILERENLKESEKYLFKTRDRGYFLKYLKKDKTHSVALISSNKETETFDIERDDIVEVWRIVKSIKIADE